MILNLLDNNKLYALSMHNRKCITFGEALKIRIKKFQQNMLENYSKSTKIAITVCKFSKIFRGSMPPNLYIFTCFSITFKFVLSKKKTLEKNVEIMPPPIKFLATPLAIFSAIT